MEIGNTRELLRGMDKYFAALIAAEKMKNEGDTVSGLTDDVSPSYYARVYAGVE